MTTTTFLSSSRPRILDQVSDVLELLSDAGRMKWAALTCQDLKVSGPEDSAGSSLQEVLRGSGQAALETTGLGSREILSPDSSIDLGHAPAWIDAGLQYEALITHIEDHGELDYIFCLDPWAAQMLSSGEHSHTRTRWVFVTDRHGQRSEGQEEYWDRMAEWFQALPFYAIIAKEVWDAALPSQADFRSPNRIAQDSSRVFLEKPGAWQWKRISERVASERATEDTLLFIVKYSGSLVHLRMLLDSVARQHHPKDRLRIAVLAQGVAIDLPEYLRWFALAQKDITVTAIDLSENSGEASLAALLTEVSGATVIWVDDHVLLPDRFSESVRVAAKTGTSFAFFGVSISLDISAQILTGNMDPSPHYEQLLNAFTQQGVSDSLECAGLFSSREFPGSSQEKARRISTRVLGGRDPRTPAPKHSLGLLRTVDLS